MRSQCLVCRSRRRVKRTEVTMERSGARFLYVLLVCGECMEILISMLEAGAAGYQSALL